jgi:hypothetical protein
MTPQINHLRRADGETICPRPPPFWGTICRGSPLWLPAFFVADLHADVHTPSALICDRTMRVARDGHPDSRAAKSRPDFLYNHIALCRGSPLWLPAVVFDKIMAGDCTEAARNLVRQEERGWPETATPTAVQRCHVLISSTVTSPCVGAALCGCPHLFSHLALFFLTDTLFLMRRLNV